MTSFGREHNDVATVPFRVCVCVNLSESFASALFFEQQIKDKNNGLSFTIAMHLKIIRPKRDYLRDIYDIFSFCLRY